MKYTIENLRHEIMDDFGDELVNFRFDIRFTEPSEVIIEDYFYSYYQLKKYLQTKDPAFHSYLDKVRSSLDEWGPAESKIFEAMGEEALALLYKYAQEYLEQADWVPPMYEWKLKLLNASPQETKESVQKAKITFAELHDHIPALKLETQRSNAFKKAVQQKLREIAIETYPEILEATQEQMKEFKNLFVSEIISLEATLYKFRKSL